MDRVCLRGEKGVSIIELLIVLAISGILTSALYQTFISLQKTCAVQEQVVDVRQNVRCTIDRMTREIRMAGYGGNILETFGSVNTYPNLINPTNGVDRDFITIVMAEEVARLGQNAASSSNQLILSGSNAGEMFDTDKKKYLCLNGLNNYSIQNVVTDTITLTAPLAEDHPIHQPVYLVKAISYYVGLSGGKSALRRDENTGGGGQPLAENIETLEFSYVDSKGDVTANPPDIRMVKVTVTARTSRLDPDYKGGDGYRRRTLSSNIKIRNLGL